MNAPVDCLTVFLGQVRPSIADPARPTKVRIQTLWAAATSARNLASSDVIANAFMTLAVEVNLIDINGHWTGDDVREDVRRYGGEYVRHTIQWALCGWFPFEGKRP